MAETTKSHSNENSPEQRHGLPPRSSSDRTPAQSATLTMGSLPPRSSSGSSDEPPSPKLSRIPSIKNLVREFGRRMSFQKDSDKEESNTTEEDDDKKKGQRGLFGLIPRSQSSQLVRYTEPLKGGDDQSDEEVEEPDRIADEPGIVIDGNTATPVAPAVVVTSTAVGATEEKTSEEDLMFVQEEQKELQKRAEATESGSTLLPLPKPLFGEQDMKAEDTRRLSWRSQQRVELELKDALGGSPLAQSQEAPEEEGEIDLAMSSTWKDSEGKNGDEEEAEVLATERWKDGLKPILKNKYAKEWLENKNVLRGGQADANFVGFVEKLQQDILLEEKTKKERPSDSEKSVRKIIFHDTVEIIPTFKKSEYSRRPDPNATFLHLNNKVKAAIRQELNEFKRDEMAVHELSQINTVFH